MNQFLSVSDLHGNWKMEVRCIVLLMNCHRLVDLHLHSHIRVLAGVPLFLQLYYLLQHSNVVVVSQRLQPHAVGDVVQEPELETSSAKRLEKGLVALLI